MPSSPVFGLPWPLGSDNPDVPRDLQALAEGTETALRYQGRWAIGTGTVTSQAAGSTPVNLTALSQEGGWTLAGGQIIPPLDGRFLIVDGVEFATSQVQVWVGAGGADNNGVVVGGGGTILWSGQYTRMVNGTAGSPLPRTLIYGAPNVYDASVTQTVVWLGEPA